MDNRVEYEMKFQTKKCKRFRDNALLGNLVLAPALLGEGGLQKNNKIKFDL